MKLGIDRILNEYGHLLLGRIGLLAHQASVNSGGISTLDILEGELGAKLTALFGPEHGITSQAQDMEPVSNEVIENLEQNRSLPIFSLYGSTLESLIPTRAMLDMIDTLVIDLQDIGARYYTYVWTASLCLKACAESKKRVLICDRPNPIGGKNIEGELQKRGYESFVGLYPLPVRHGMTVGEILSYVMNEYKIKGDFHIIPMQDWQREWSWPKTKLNWINPSPNMRSFNAALLYPGMCLIEGTNISEGRGTQTPFEIVGAPYIDTEELIDALEKLYLPGIKCAPTSFIPVRQKWMGQLCSGVRWTITDEGLFRPYLTGLAFIWTVNQLYKEKGFAWRLKPYEFVTDKPAIDLLTGSAFFRENIDKDFGVFKELAGPPEEFLKIRQRALLY